MTRTTTTALAVLLILLPAGGAWAQQAASRNERMFAVPAPAGVKIYNPAFDVTDADLITAIVTEKGIARPPYGKSLAAFFS